MGILSVHWRLTSRVACSFNSIQNSLFSSQHIVHTTTFFAHNLLKRERSEYRAHVGSFPIIIYNYLYTRLLIGNNDLNNHDDLVLAMLLQSCKHMKTRNSCRIYKYSYW